MNETEDRNETRVLDIRSDVCPYTFVKSKLALEELEPGQILEIQLGNSESASNVPRSLSLEHHEVTRVDKSGPSTWTVTVRKG
jgi:tRNA 2-thiouridine synthesizing protein A